MNKYVHITLTSGDNISYQQKARKQEPGNRNTEPSVL